MLVNAYRAFGTLLAAAILLATLVPVVAAQEQPADAGVPGRSFGSWATRCYEHSEREPTCVVFQNAVLPDSGARLVYVEAGYPPDQEQPVLFVTAPLGVYLPAGVEARVDDAARQPITMLHCDQNGCHGASILQQPMFAALREGERLVITFRNVSGRVLEVPLSLDGFTPAWEAVISGETPASTSGNGN